MLKNKTKGFTMIELLMVVGIIALLVAIAIVAVTVVRTKAGNSVIKNDVDQLRKYAETIYAENGLRGYCMSSGAYSCFESINPRLNELTADMNNRSKKPTENKILSDNNNFCISANLSDGSYYCVDSTANQTTNSGSFTGKCSTTQFLCQ